MQLFIYIPCTLFICRLVLIIIPEMSLMLLRNSGESRPDVTIVIFVCQKAATRAGRAARCDEFNRISGR